MERQRARRKNVYQGELTPEEQEARRAKWRETKRRQVERDPEGTKAKRAKWAKTSEDRRREAMGRSAVLELRRIDEACRKERVGKTKLKPLGMIRKRNTRSGTKLPIGPFRAWLQDLLRAEETKGWNGERIDAEGRVSRLVGVTPRTLYSWIHEESEVDEAVVDRAASRHGGVMAEEIYRTYANEEETKPENVSEGYVGTCKTPGCKDPAVRGKRFCEPCGARLALVRGQLANETEKFRSQIRRKGAHPTCCNAACREPRPHGQRFCDACVEEGWSEEMYDD